MHPLAHGFMSFAMSIKCTTRNEALTAPTKLISLKCNYCARCFPFLTLSLVSTLHIEEQGCFKDSLHRLGWGHYNWKQKQERPETVTQVHMFDPPTFTSNCWDLWSSEVCHSNLFSIGAWLASILYHLKKSTKSKTLPHYISRIMLPTINNLTTKF